jgi:hypothetical protein
MPKKKRQEDRGSRKRINGNPNSRNRTVNRYSENVIFTFTHRRMARGDHGLPKVSLGPIIPDPSMPCRRATPETALQPLRPAAVFYPFEDSTSYGYDFYQNEIHFVPPILRHRNPITFRGFERKITKGFCFSFSLKVPFIRFSVIHLRRKAPSVGKQESGPKMSKLDHSNTNRSLLYYFLSFQTPILQ